MAVLSLIEMSAAPKPVRKTYRAFQAGMGFPVVPNFLKVQGSSPSAASGCWRLLEDVLLSGVLPRPVKEMLVAAISADRDCSYCEAAHLACCRMLGVDPETLEALVNDVEGLTPEKLKDIVMFGIKCARDPKSLSGLDFNTLRDHGLDDEEIMELIAMAGLALYLNVIADATAIETDSLFAQV